MTTTPQSGERETAIRDLARRHREQREAHGYCSGGGTDYPGLLIDAVAIIDALRAELDAAKRNAASLAWPDGDPRPRPTRCGVCAYREQQEARYVDYGPLPATKGDDRCEI